MRVVFVALAAAAVALSAATGTMAAEPKKPKPVDIKKEMDEKCGAAPYGLVDLDGKKASKAEMEEAKFQVTSFITQVDVYQECMLKLATALNERLTDNDRRIMGLAIAQSQDEKEAVGAAFNNAVCEYNHVHKIPDKDCKDGKWIANVVEQKPAAKETKPAQPTKPATTTAPGPKTPAAPKQTP
jgi:hypothetical protein